MIFDALFNFIMSGVNMFLGWLPDLSLPSADFLEVAQRIGEIASSINNYFPVATLGVCLALVMAVKVGLIFWRFAIFIYKLLPFT